MKLRDAYGRTGYQFLREHFECENCLECGKGARGHDAIPMNLGHYSNNQILWFARCRNVKT